MPPGAAGGGRRRLDRLPVLSRRRRRRRAPADSRGRRRLDGLRAASGPRRTLVVRKPFRCIAFDVGDRRAAHAHASRGTVDIAWARSRPRRPPQRGAGLPGGHRRGRGVSGVRVHAVHRPARRRPVDFFADAVARTAPARAAYLAGDWGAVASLSPELFLRRCGEAVTSSPIKGTLPRHAQPSALRASVKDVAENIMIVDLVRNDLSRVAVTGTVTVPELLAVRPAPGVWHLVSTVTARVGVDVPMAAVLDATFPPASVTGTPKTRARQLLSSGSRIAAESIAAQSVWRRRSAGTRAERRDPHRRVRRRGWRRARCRAAASPPTPIPTRNGRSACTRRHRSSGSHPPRAQHRVVELTP